MQKLSRAGAGEYTVKWIFDETEVVNLLKEIDIEVGRKVSVISNMFGGMVVRSDKGKYAIDPELLLGVTV